jgi:Periplasmic copper-binding protein (NosD)
MLAAASLSGCGSTEAVSDGPELWVARSGDDDNPGSSDRPLRTIAAALERADPGGRVLVRDGTYPETVVSSPRGAPQNPIELRPAPGASPVVSGGFKLIGARHVRVTGITFDGSRNPDGFGTSIWDSRDIEYSGNEITGYGRAQGVLIKDSSRNVRILSNRIHDLGERERFEHGIYCENARGVVIAGNLIHDNPAGYGIHLFGDCDGTRIIRNTIAHNGLSGIIIAGNDSRGTADRTLIADNVIAGHGEAHGYGEYGYAVTEYLPGRGNVIRDNLFHANAREPDVNCPSCAQSGNLELTPGFVDEVGRDYRLQAAGAARARRVGATGGWPEP